MRLGRSRTVDGPAAAEFAAVRPPRSPGAPAGRIEGLDALRGASALGVFVCHAVSYWPWLGLPHHVEALSQLGARGVDVFIVLSGFALMMPLARPGRRLVPGQFLLRRAWRILPPYWVALALAAALAMSPLWTHVVASPATWSDVAVHVVGLQTWFPRRLGTINGSLWSISLELMLYLSFPVLVLCWRRLGTAVVLAGSLVLSLLWVVLVGDNHQLPMRLVQFAGGMLVARGLARRGARRRDRGPVTAAALASTLLGCALNTVRATDALLVPVWGLAGALLIWACATWAGGPGWRRADAIGRRSFSFYLLHQPVVLLLAAPLGTTAGGPWEVRLGLGLAVGLVLATAVTEPLYRLVELPSHRSARRRFPEPVRD